MAFEGPEWRNLRALFNHGKDMIGVLFFYWVIFEAIAYLVKDAFLKTSLHGIESVVLIGTVFWFTGQFAVDLWNHRIRIEKNDGQVHLAVF